MNDIYKDPILTLATLVGWLLGIWLVNSALLTALIVNLICRTVSQ